MFLFRFVTILMLTAYASMAVALEQAKIVVIPLQGFTTENDNSRYDQLINAFGAEQRSLVTLTRVPIARGIQMIREGLGDCLFAMSGAMFEHYFEKETVSSDPIQTGYWRFVTRSTDDTIKRSAQLAGSIIAIPNGMDVERTGLNKSFFGEVVAITEEASIVKMLRAGRVDVGVLSIIDENLYASHIHYAEDYFYSKVERGLNCSATHPHAKQIVTRFQAFLKKHQWPEQIPSFRPPFTEDFTH